ncbi:MAG: HAD-IB family phosphatase [Candidatus Staskawiczbacteria bacterium]|nr:HAD-IB family phosphatase [Candidatus Staskawiczbacteria bacterium]MBI3337081.1 HAD-IB family phosphatase [Candidatus Staskawiczbacteria bacterium]
MTDVNLFYQKIITIIKQSTLPAFAVFDFDNTCIANDITEATLAYMASNNLFRDKNLLEVNFEDAGSEMYSKAVFDNYYHLLKENQVKEAYQFISKILSGFNVNEISLLVSKVIDFEGKDITKYNLFGREVAKGIKPREHIIGLIDLLKNSGIEVWIITASIEVLVKEVIKRFDIKTKVIGVRNTMIDGKFTAELEKPLSMFEGKVECIKKFIDPEKKPLFGAGDSIYDLAMLEYCKIKVVVDRSNALAAKAKENGWFLI